MKILHIISSSGMYGAEAVILNLARTMATGKDSCALCIFDNASNPNHQLWDAARTEAIEAYLIPCSGRFDRATTSALRSIAASSHADVIHAHGYKADIYCWLALRHALPLISTCHTWYDTDRLVTLYGAIDRLVLRGFTSVVAVSDQVRQRLLHAGIRPNHIHLVRNGIDLEPFTAAIPSLRSHLPPDTLLVGLIGRLAWEKGIDIYLRAIALVLREFPHAHFAIIGEGPERDRLQTIVDSLHLGSSVAFLGRRDDMPSVYASLDIMVSSSRLEGLPIALLEGMASHLPVVATAVGEVPGLVQNGVTGLLVPPEDPAALATAMLTLLRDPQSRSRLALAAQTKIASEYAADRMAEDYRNIYQQAIAARQLHQPAMQPPQSRGNSPTTLPKRTAQTSAKHLSQQPNPSTAPISKDTLQKQPNPRVFMMDLWATLPYYTAYLSRALLAEGANLTIGSITYYLDPECYSSRGLRLQPGFMDLVGRFPLPRWPRRILKLIESLLNMAALSVRFAVAAPDIIHVQFLPMLTSRLPLDLWFIRYCRFRGSRIVLTVHDLLPHNTGEAHKTTFVALYSIVDALICHSPTVQSKLIHEFNVPQARITVIPHGPFFYDLSPAEDGRAHLPFNPPPNQPLVLWQGILSPYKGVDILLDAWKEVESRSHQGYLVIMGTGNPDLLDQIRKQAARLNLQRLHLEFRFIPIDELVAAYRAAAIVTYPYRAITTSGALATGLALGKTILASDLPVFRETLRDGENALLFPPPDPGTYPSHTSNPDAKSASSLAAALIELITKPELREQLASRVRAMNFGAETWRSIAAQTLETYRSVVQTTP